MNNLQKERLKSLKEILNGIIGDNNLSNDLIFKGGTSLMLFYNLDRFSEDLDFNFSKDETIDIMNNRLSILGYNFESKDTVYGRLYKVEYGNEENKFHCIIDLAKYKYKTSPKFNIKFFGGKPIKVLSLSHNFAHKISAFYERKKGRDVVDINFYLSKGVFPDNDILMERHNRDFKQNLVIFLKELQTPYINQRLKNALDQLHFKNYTIEEFKDNIIQNLRKNYTNNSFNFNLSYKDNINSGLKIIPLTDRYILLIDGNIINKDLNNKYSVLNQSDMKLIYGCNKEEKLFEYINNIIINESLIITKNNLNNLKII